MQVCVCVCVNARLWAIGQFYDASCHLRYISFSDDSVLCNISINSEQEKGFSFAVIIQHLTTL